MKGYYKRKLLKYISTKCFYCSKKFKNKKALSIHQTKCFTKFFYQAKIVFIKRKYLNEFLKIFEEILIPATHYSSEELKFSHKGEIGFLKGMRIVVEEIFFS
jgi:hypothetical protein